MSAAPSVSALIPAHEPSDDLERAIESVLKQSVEPDEVIVVADGPGVREFVARLDEPRIRLRDGPGRGVAAARNVGLHAAGTTWVALLDSDDQWFTDYVKSVRDAIAAEPSAGLCFSGAVHVSEDGEVLNWSGVRKGDATLEGLLTRRLQPTTSATTVKRDLALSLGGFDEHFRCASGVEDVDLWWRIAALSPCVVQPAPLVRYVVHERRDRARSVGELRDLAADRRRCVARLQDHVPPLLFRRAAAQHLAIMARYWIVADLGSNARREAIASILYAPTGNGVAALALALLPRRMRRYIREVRRAAIRRTRRP